MRVSKGAHACLAESIMTAGTVSLVACEPRKNGAGAWKTFVADYGLAQAPERSKSLAKDIWNFLTSRHSPWVA